MRQPLFVGMAGASGAGKTTIADLMLPMLQCDHGFGETKVTVSAKRHPFARPIKEGLAAMGIDKTNAPEAYRTFAQYVGAGMRARDPDWWVRQHASHRDTLWTLPQFAHVLIADDVRYENECKACGLVFFISPDFSPKALTAEQTAHESEDMARRGFDPARHTHEIRNTTGTPEAAARSIVSIVRARLCPD